MEIGAFAFLGGEFESQFVDFLVAAGCLGIYGAALGNVIVPFREDGVGAVHGRAADFGFLL
jgi:hypothetical protein